MNMFNSLKWSFSVANDSKKWPFGQINVWNKTKLGPHGDGMNYVRAEFCSTSPTKFLLLKIRLDIIPVAKYQVEHISHH